VPLNEQKIAPGKRRPTVLIVDDTPANIQILAQALMHDYAIQTAANGLAALAIVQGADKPDLILLDVLMPAMDGYEVCRLIKQDPATWHIPVIFVTAKDQYKDQQRGFDLGAVDYITKPFGLPLVIARVKVHIRLKLKSEMLEKLALLDGLTDIPNRRGLEEALTREWGRAKRSGTPISALMIDVDCFKAFNDHYGHGAGDECLRRVAQALERGLMRPGDFIGRYGGEEFSVILPNCDAAGAALVAENLCERVAALSIAHERSPAAGHITISIGYTTQMVGAESTWSALLNEADKALYLAKTHGRNRISGCEKIDDHLLTAGF
jgi:diguanylate cyclase (GGDEF)-like protein